MSNWWDNAPVIEPKPAAGNWWDSAPEVPLDEARMLSQEARKNRLEAEVDKGKGAGMKLAAAIAGPLVPASVVRDVGATLVGLGTSVVAPAARQVGMDETADKLNRFGDAYEQVARKHDEEGIVPPILKRTLRGAGKTIPTSIVAGRFLGPYGAIGSAALQERDQAITEARDMGMSEAEVRTYANTQGVIEGIVAAAFQKVGFGGFESAVGRRVASKAVLPAAKQALKDALAELPEENITEIGHAVARSVASGKPLTPKQIWETMKETSVQTAVTLGAVETPNIISGGVTGAARAQELARLKEIRNDQKRYVTVDEGKELGFTDEQLKNRESRGKALDGLITQAEQEIESEVPTETPPVEEEAEVQATAGEVVPPEVQVEPEAAPPVDDSVLKGVIMAQDAANPPDVLAQGPTEIVVGKEPEAIPDRTLSYPSAEVAVPESPPVPQKRPVRKEAAPAQPKRRGLVPKPKQQAEEWLNDALTRKPGELKDPKAVAEWITKGFGDENYSKAVPEGKTLEQVVSDWMGPKPPETPPAAPQPDSSPEPTPVVPVTPVAPQEAVGPVKSKGRKDQYFKAYAAEIGKYRLGPVETETGTKFGVFAAGDERGGPVATFDGRDSAIQFMETQKQADEPVPPVQPKEPEAKAEAIQDEPYKPPHSSEEVRKAAQSAEAARKRFEKRSGPMVPPPIRIEISQKIATQEERVKEMKEANRKYNEEYRLRAEAKAVPEPLPPVEEKKAQEASGSITLKDDEYDLSKLSDAALRHLSRKNEGTQSYSDGGDNLKVAVTKELGNRKLADYTKGPEGVGEGEYKAWSKAREDRETAEQAIPTEEVALSKLEKSLFQTAARNLKIPFGGRGKHGYSAAKQYAGAIKNAEDIVKASPEMAAQAKKIEQAKQAALDRKEAAKKAEDEYYRVAGAGFPPVPAGVRYSLEREGRAYTTITVHEFDPARGKYRIESHGNESWVAPQPLLDNYVSKEEQDAVLQAERSFKESKDAKQRKSNAAAEKKRDEEEKVRLKEARSNARKRPDEKHTEVAKTKVKADKVLDSFDLGKHKSAELFGLKTHGLAMVKEMAKQVPEFAYEPIFTVNSKKQLVFRDGVTYTLNPESFNLHPSELTEGQTVGINLEDIGLQQISASEAVGRTLKNVGFSNVKVTENGVSATWGGSAHYLKKEAGKRVSLVGKGDKWRVEQSTLLPGAARMAEEQLAKIHFLEGGKPFQAKTPTQQAADKATQEEGEGVASLQAGITRQTRSSKPKTEGEAPIAAADIQKTAERLFNVPIRQEGFSDRAAGIYKWLSGKSRPPSPAVIRTGEDYFASLGVIAHEVAHHIDETTKAVRGMPKEVKTEIKRLDYEPQKGRVFEGWAEFLRRYMTEPPIDVNGKQVPNPAIDAPQTYAWFEGTWLPAHPEVAKSIAEFRGYAQQFSNQSAFARLASLISDKQPKDLSFKEEWLAKSRRFVNRLKTDFVDKFHTLEWIQEAAKKKGHKGIGIYDLTMAHFMSASSHATIAFEEGVKSLQTGKPIGTTSLWGLRDHLESDGEYEDAVLYAAARHTLFMEEKKPGYNTAFDVEDAENWISEVEASGKSDRFEAFAQGLAQFNNDLLKMLVEAGALPQDQADNMLRYYGGKNYFPLHRVREGDKGRFAGSGVGFVNLGKAVKGRSRKGSGRQIIDPIDATVAQAMRFYGRAIQARQQHVLAETLDPKLGGVGGMGGLMDRVDPKRKVTQGNIEEILDTLVDEGVVEADDSRAMKIAAQLLNSPETVSEKSLKWFAERHGIEEEDGEVDVDALMEAAQEEPNALAVISLWRPDYTPNASKRTVLIYDKQGNPLMYELDQDLYATTTGMDEVQFGPFMSVFREAARWFKTGAVGASTGFGTANLLRDYWEFQGKARHAKGLSTLGKPPEMLGRYIAEKARKLTGHKANDPLIRLYEESGGKVYSVVGHDAESRTRYRRRRIGKSVLSKLGITLSRPGDSAESVLQGMMDLIAVSDAPPRLADAEAAIREEGFEIRDGNWYNVEIGQEVDRLPEHVRIKAAVAMAEATVNFKRIGAKGQYVEAFLPFFNAAIQASHRQWGQIKGLKSLGKKDVEGTRAARYVVYLSALASTSILYWLLRHDDDDWREQEAHLRDGYWTWGRNGKTYLRIPKPRDSAVISNLTENMLDAWYHDDARDTSDVVLRDFGGRIPTGGGLGRGLVETFVADYDYFRGRDLTPDYLKDLPKEQQTTPYTSRASNSIGQVSGPYLGISPIQTDHLLSSASGGFYHRMTDLYDSARDGRLGPEHIPFLRGLVLDRHQARSVSDFYTELENLKIQGHREKAAGKVSDETTGKQAVLDGYAEMMTEIRNLEREGGTGRRDYQYQPYVVGLARSALGYDELKGNPNPLVAKDAPEEVQKIVSDYLQRTVYAATEPLKDESKYKDAESYERERRSLVRAQAQFQKLKADGAIEDAQSLLQEYYLKPDSTGKRGSIREKDTGELKDSYRKKLRALAGLGLE
jgi:hypothetical protein